MPTIGSEVALRQPWTAARAIGFSAGPERPPVPVLSFGCSSESSARPRIVFTSESPSAPASSTARATAGTSQLAGESFA